MLSSRRSAAAAQQQTLGSSSSSAAAAQQQQQLSRHHTATTTATTTTTTTSRHSMRVKVSRHAFKLQCLNVRVSHPTFRNHCLSLSRNACRNSDPEGRTHVSRFEFQQHRCTMPVRCPYCSLVRLWPRTRRTRLHARESGQAVREGRGTKIAGLSSSMDQGRVVSRPGGGTGPKRQARAVGHSQHNVL